jgi:hypothetical protein
MLDQLGDESSMRDRLAYFRKVDTDDSNCIDFGEFLELVHDVTTGARRDGQQYVTRIMAASQCSDLPIQLQTDLGIL